MALTGMVPADSSVLSGVYRTPCPTCEMAMQLTRAGWRCPWAKEAGACNWPLHRDPLFREHL